MRPQRPHPPCKLRLPRRTATGQTRRLQSSPPGQMPSTPPSHPWATHLRTPVKRDVSGLVTRHVESPPSIANSNGEAVAVNPTWSSGIRKIHRASESSEQHARAEPTAPPSRAARHHSALEAYRSGARDRVRRALGLVPANVGRAAPQLCNVRLGIRGHDRGELKWVASLEAVEFTNAQPLTAVISVAQAAAAKRLSPSVRVFMTFHPRIDCGW